jgi:ribosomal-protein-alanine N-acetyltransferase
MSTIMPRKKEKQAVRFHIRWMIERDKKNGVLEIESLSFGDNAWSENDFSFHLGKRDTIGMVAELDDQVVGFAVYELHKSRIHVLNIAVHPKFRRMGVGSAMMDKLIYKLSFERRNRIELGVADHNLGAHLFFKACGMRCEKMNFDEDIQQHWYEFVYRFGKES